MTSYETAATVLGALLVGGALLSGIARRSFLSLTAVFVLVGVMLGQGGLEVLDIDPRSDFVKDLALTALVLILFRDGLEVEAEMLQKAWHLPLRKPVLALTAALSADSDFVWWKFVLQDLTLGVGYGLVVGYLASRVLPRGDRLEESIPAHQRALYALGVAFLTYGLTTLPPHGNGVIAVFVCAIVLGIRRPDIPKHFEMSEDIIEIVKLGIFVVFG